MEENILKTREERRELNITNTALVTAYCEVFLPLGRKYEQRPLGYKSICLSLHIARVLTGLCRQGKGYCFRFTQSGHHYILHLQEVEKVETIRMVLDHLYIPLVLAMSR